MKLITWNVAARRALLERQVEFLANRSPDLVTLQEITPRTAPLFRDQLRAQAALGHFRFSKSLDPGGLSPRRSRGVLIACRTTLSDDIIPIASPWSEKTLSTVVEDGSVPYEVHTVHVPPGSSNGWTKVEVLEAVFEALARPSLRPRILTGDFNAPQAERSDGTIITWAQRIGTDGEPRERKRFRGGSALRWDVAERNVLTGLAEFGITDAFRSLHGYEREAASWILRNVRGEFARRFDHVLLSDSFTVASAEYLAEPTNAGLSDHRPLEVVLERRRG